MTGFFIYENDASSPTRQEPVRVIRGPVTGLPVPADAEIAIEGFLPPVAVVVTDSDIDITSTEQIFWVLSTRLNPDRDIHALPHVWGNPLFKASSDQSPGFSSRVVIDAAIPWESRNKIPPPGMGAKGKG